MSFTQFSLNSGGGESLDLHISKHQPKPKKPFQMTQKGWILTTAVLLVTCLGLSIYITYEAVHKGDRIDQILYQISHRFPSIRENVLDFAVIKNQPKWVETLLRSNSKKQLEQKGHTFYSPEIAKLLIDFGLGRPESDSGIGYSIPKLGIGTDSEIDENRYPKSCNFALFLSTILARF